MFASLPGLEPRRVLYTPNFAPRDEYAWAFEQGVTVTIDNLYVLRQWPQLFEGREVMVRVDTGTARGHHQHVQTAGEQAKFGVPLEELPELARRCAAAGLPRRSACTRTPAAGCSRSTAGRRPQTCCSTRRNIFRA